MTGSVPVMEVPRPPPDRGEAPVPVMEVPPLPPVRGEAPVPVTMVWKGRIITGLHEQDCNSLEYEELAKFAVDEHNNKHQNCLEKLKFSKLVKVHTLERMGYTYFLLMEVEDQGGQVRQYEGRIWEKWWQNFKRVEEFSPVEAPEVVS